MQTSLNEALAIIKEQCGIDMSGYRRMTLERRLAAQLSRIGISDFKEYAARLRNDRNECQLLVNALTVNVSSFFRNAIMFEIMAQRIVPAIIERKRRQRRKEIRVWSAGCASGEEPYTMAIILAQALKDEIAQWSVRIFATDIDNGVLQAAREAIYPRDRLLETKLGVVDNCFIAEKGQFRLRPEMQAMAIFSLYDLLAEGSFAPADSVFGDFDIVLCRNVLIYLAPEQQARALAKLAQALRAGGYLALGDSECLAKSVAGLFDVEDSRNCIFRRRAPAQREAADVFA